jgi:hypothetical protein
MTALLESAGVYRPRTVARPQECVARLYADRIDVVATDGGSIASLPISGIEHTSASACALVLNGYSYKVVSIEFMLWRKKWLLAAFGLVPWFIAAYFGEGRKTAIAWRDNVNDLREAQSSES